MYSCAVICGRMPILTVSVVLTSNLVTVQMYKFALCCVKLCSYMEMMSNLKVSVLLTSILVTAQFGYAVYSCAIIWGRVPILTVSVLLSSNSFIVEVCGDLRCTVYIFAFVWGCSF